MLLPQFSLRTTLKALSACAVLFVVVRQAVLGQFWAIAVSCALLSVVVCFVFYALFYALTVGMSRVVGTQQLPARTSQGGLQLTTDEHQPPDSKAVEDSSKTRAQA